jgi:recombination protein U
MAYWNTRGLRGSALEEIINLTNQLYLRRGMAVIQKVPTPITPIEVSNENHTISKAYFEKKSTVDYIGVANGTALCFDVKETRVKNLPLNNIHPHQLAFMEAFERQGGLAFLLVQFHFSGEIFMLPCAQIINHFKTAETGGRKSIPYAAFDPAYRVYNSSGFPVHYLDVALLFLQNNHPRQRGQV